MRDFFLSASVPLPTRDSQYYMTADIIAIREAVKAFVEVVVMNGGTIVFGGHPAITPIITNFVKIVGKNKDSIILYQSDYFPESLSIDNDVFANIVRIGKIENNREKSLKKMREDMLVSRPFKAGIFIGGMEGVEEEFDLFRKYNPSSILLPIASTGAAALKIFNRNVFSKDLLTEMTYPALFRKYLQL